MPDMVVIQDVQNQSNNATFKMLAQLQGAIYGYCTEYEYDVRAISPSAWRKQLGFNMGRTIKRNSLKVQAVDYAAQHCGKKLCDDQADAVCIGYAIFKIFESEE